MNDKFDELAKGLAESVTRRQALRRRGDRHSGGRADGSYPAHGLNRSRLRARQCASFFASCAFFGG